MKPLFTLLQWNFRLISLTLILLLQGSISLSYAQTYAFQHITEKEGLPTTYLYGALQDKQGYIWLTGESGLVWYNGLVYRQPEIQSKFKDEIIRFFKNKSEEIWMQDLAGKVLFYNEGEIIEFPEIIPGLVYRNTEVYDHPEGDIWISNTTDVFIYKSELDSLTRLDIDNEKNQLQSIKVFGQTKTGQTLLMTETGFYFFKEKKGIFQPYKDNVIIEDINFGFSIARENYIVVGNNIFHFNPETRALKPYLQNFQSYFNDRIVDFHEDVNGSYWFATQNGLLKIDENENGEKVISRHLEGEVMNKILKDREGNIWFITEQNGLFILPSLAIKIFNQSSLNQQIRFVKQNSKGQLVLGFDNNQFKVIDESFNVHYDIKLFAQNSRLYDMVIDEEGDQYFITSKGFVQFDKNYKLKKRGKSLYLKSAAFSPEGTLWLATSYFFGRFKEGVNVEEIIEKRTYSLLPISDNEVWVGTIEGLFLYKNGQCKKIENPGLYHDIRDIKLLENGELLLATQKDGLLCYQPSRDSVLFNLSTKNGLSNDNCSKIWVDDQYFWLGTKKGINRIDRDDFSITIIGMDQGLPSNEVNDVHKTNGKIYVATNRGVAVFDDNINLERDPPGLQISNIKINEKDTLINKFYQLDYAQNNIKVEFSAITFNDADQAIFQYKMEGIDQDWVQSKVNIAQYPSLPPGEFTFYVKTKTTNSGWSDEQSIRFKISRPFWKSWWFYLLTGILILGIAYLIFIEIDRRKSVLRDMRFSQLTALRAQMNPHFLFNALNSIQEFIVNKDTRSANRYLSQFARLMRNILNVSDKDRITLSKEIESLRLYLSLEALRFGDTFEYVLEVDENIDKDSIYLPPMLVQPFVENAIKHGLMHLESIKKLYLRFSIREGFLICEVEDNGIGRDMSAEIKIRNPQIFPSKATSLTNERIRLFNAISNNSLQVKVIDLKDENDKSAGTKIILTINSSFKGFYKNNEGEKNELKGSAYR